jgi:succinate dehydrogenase / fumarate reductase, cytochrome b subunit
MTRVRAPKSRPKFLNVLQIQMPVGALTSIGHRITGMLLFVSVPVGLYLLDRSLYDERGFAAVIALFDSLGFKAVTVLALWAFAHHFLAGIRHLLTDFDVGSTLHAARRSAWWVNVGGVALALCAAAVLL